MSLDLKNITKIYGPRPASALERFRDGADRDTLLRETGHTLALNNVSLSIPEARTTVIMGLSGSGKSTLVRIINRLIDPTAGEVLLDGTDLITLDPEELKAVRRERITMVFQHFALLPHRTVLSNVSYGLQIKGMKRAERDAQAAEWIKLVGLEGYERSRPGELSGGMRQRVGLARALAVNGDILLMDEPFSALDPLTRRDMQDLLVQLQDRLKKTIVFITHDLDEALTLGDSIAMLKDGEIVQTGTPRDFLLSPRPGYVADFMRDANRLRGLRASNVMMDAPVVIQDTERPFSVLRKARAAESDIVYVVDSRGRPRGVVTADAARAAASATTGTAAGIMDRLPVISPDATLDEVVQPLMATPHPLPVAKMGLSGPQGPLLGIVSRNSLLAALALEH